MISDKTGKQLHDRLSRGETLSTTEQAQLTTWYAAQDAAEADLLHQPAINTDLGTLQQQVDAASAQLTSVTERIQQVTAENSTLRQEISRLRKQLADQKQPA
jgi:peptidoglycan hydrolase CwlO-like protein